MQIIGNLFNIVLFVTAAGGALTLLSLLIGCALRCALPLWFCICGMLAYILPLRAPGLRLVPPTEQLWLEGYSIACLVWAGGVAALLVAGLIRTALARRAIRAYRSCGDARINGIALRCARLAGLRRPPDLYFGTLADPACVAGALRPAVILNEGVSMQLTDAELTAVLSHEMMHIRRRHLLLGRAFDCACALHWFNPLVWIARRRFALHCETDCDQHTLTRLRGQLSAAAYAGAMLRLLELSAPRSGKPAHGMRALGFLAAKRRIRLILHRPARAGRIAAAIALTLALAASILLSMGMSRGHFYPYPAYDAPPEHSAAAARPFFDKLNYNSSYKERRNEEH